VISRRYFLEVAIVASGGVILGACGGSQQSAPSIAPAPQPSSSPVINFLGWDTEGTGRESLNLLRGPMKCAGADVTANGLTFTVSGKCELTIPFSPKVTPTTIIPSDRTADGHALAPLIVHAPDHGQMLLSAPGVKARLEGVRDFSSPRRDVDLILEVPAATTFTLTPIRLNAPQGLQDTALFNKARRLWFNPWCPSSKWGDQASPMSAPAGLPANNSISDICSFSLPFAADPCIWIPQITTDISYLPTIRRAIDFWMNQRMVGDQVIGYWNVVNFMDANAGIISAAWSYYEATQDEQWLTDRIEKLEHLSDFIESRDIDGDGLIEAPHSGNDFSIVAGEGGCSWWDLVNSGHKDGYTNALIYRAWRRIADLESALGRPVQQLKYSQLADLLKAAYEPALMTPNGWLAWWRDASGNLHDYASTLVNGIAIEFGLVSDGKAILAKLWDEITRVGFASFELGVPATLHSIRRADYLPNSPNLGTPLRDDGTDSFQHYMNGGITPGMTIHFLMAHYVAGVPDKADMILRAMVDHGKFQAGVESGKPIDWTTWDGSPCGYEGYLSDAFAFVQAIVLREQSFRDRYYRPLRSA
jgi:hypothetical protein